MNKSVYAIVAGEYIKFGVAANPKKRLAFLQANCPLVAKLASVLGPTDSKLAYELEWVIHRACQRFHVRGEWFRMAPRTMAARDLIAKLRPEEAWCTFSAWASTELRMAIEGSQERTSKSFDSGMPR